MYQDQTHDHRRAVASIGCSALTFVPSVVCELEVRPRVAGHSRTRSFPPAQSVQAPTQGKPSNPAPRRKGRVLCRLQGSRQVTVSIPFRRPGPVDDTVAASKAGDLTHFSVAQFKIEQCKIFLQSLSFARARDDDNRLLDKPAQTNLGRTLAVGLTYFFQHLVAYGIAASDRAIGDYRHFMFATGRDDLVLIQKRMAFDLIADQRLP